MYHDPVEVDELKHDMANQRAEDAHIAKYESLPDQTWEGIADMLEYENCDADLTDIMFSAIGYDALESNPATGESYTDVGKRMALELLRAVVNNDATELGNMLMGNARKFLIKTAHHMGEEYYGYECDEFDKFKYEMADLERALS